MSKEMYEQKIKELQEKFPDIRSHRYDEYRCKYFRGVIDIQFDYIKELEENCEKMHKQANELSREMLLLTDGFCIKKIEKRIGIKDRYKRISETDAFKEAYVDRDIGETLEIKEDL